MWLTLLRARRAIRVLCPSTKVISFGATYVDPRYLAIWIQTRTDEERDQLAAKPALIEQIREALLKVGYPSLAVPKVSISFESQETVDRDYKGQWFLRFK
jgi:hypothetical protein